MKRANRSLVVCGIDRGDAEAIADGAVGRRAASLAEDSFCAAGKGDDVVHGQEVARVIEPGDEREFLADSSLDDLSGTPSG